MDLILLLRFAPAPPRFAPRFGVKLQRSPPNDPECTWTSFEGITRGGHLVVEYGKAPILSRILIIVLPPYRNLELSHHECAKMPHGSQNKFE